MSVNIKKHFNLLDFFNLEGYSVLQNRVYDVIRVLKSDRNHEWIYCSNGKERPVKNLNILFIGQTGTGKSTTINRLTGGEYMLTSDVLCCTKEMNSITYEIDDDVFISFCDMPGLGENSDVDRTYKEWYDNMYDSADCVVYMLSADKRDLAIDEEEFSKLLRKDPNKIFVGINCIDKIPPLSRGVYNRPSSEQLMNIIRKIDDVARQFRISHYRILEFSAMENYNVDLLKKRICETIIENMNLDSCSYR